MPGIKCKVPSQSTIDKESGGIIQPYEKHRFLAAVDKWIIVSGLPFTTIQNPFLQEAF